MKILIRCGDCPKWRDEHCSKLNQARHARRELCPTVWLNEASKIAKAVHMPMDKIKHLGMTLDPKRTWEAVGVTYSMLPSEVKTIKPGKKKAKATK